MKTRKETLHLLQPLMRELQPYCQKLEIAGSLRRGAQQTDCATLLCIPQNQKVAHQEGLFEGTSQKIETRHPKFCQIIDGYPKIDGNSQQQAFSRLVNGLWVGFHVATPHNWGLMLHMLTGSNSHVKETRERLKSHGYKWKGGSLYRYGKSIAVPDEQALYQLAQLPYTPPELRHTEEDVINQFSTLDKNLLWKS